MVSFGSGPIRVCYFTKELFKLNVKYEISQAIKTSNYNALNKILSECPVEECGLFREVHLVASILYILSEQSTVDYSLSIGLICADSTLPAALAISASEKTYTILVNPGVLPKSIGEASIGFYSFATLHELMHMAVNYRVLWKRTYDYLIKVYYDRPDITAKLVDHEKLNAFLTPVIESTTNALTYTYYLASKEESGTWIRRLYEVLPIVPIPGVVWSDYIGQDKIAEYLRQTELADSGLESYLTYAPDRVECLRDWISHAIDYDKLEAFYNDCVSKGDNPAKCWWEKNKYMWNSYILLPAKIIKLIENVNVEENVKPLRAQELFSSFDEFKKYMMIVCGYDEDTSKQIWDSNEIIEFEIHRVVTTNGKTGKQCRTEVIERRPLCGRGGGEGMCPRVPPRTPIPPPPRPVLPPGVGDMPIEDLFRIKEVRTSVPVPEPIRKIMGEETRITWKER